MKFYIKSELRCKEKACKLETRIKKFEDCLYKVNILKDELEDRLRLLRKKLRKLKEYYKPYFP